VRQRNFKPTGLAALFLACVLGASASGTITNRGQWIVVGPPDFGPILKPLIERRSKEGFEVTAVFSPQVTNSDFVVGRLKQQMTKVRSSACVLLAGMTPLVASLRGDVERMAGQETDAGYGLPDSDGAPTIAVGRFPARSGGELQSMIAKTLRFEDDESADEWRERLFLLVGNPGGGVLPEFYVQSAVDADLARLNPQWTVRALFNVSTSRFFYPPPLMTGAARAMFGQGAMFSIYLGHSSPSNTDFLGSDGFRALTIEHGAGPFFTCGCFALQSNDQQPGYGLEAMRNPRGPSAVIGATGESYSAAGQLASRGLMTCFARTSAPERLGQYWLAAASGLARGDMDAATFSLMDMADGSNGKESLATLRREHLQMWMLLGDPAMLLPMLPGDVTIEAPGIVEAGKTLSLTAILPRRLENAAVSVTLERPANSHPVGLKQFPAPTAKNWREVSQIVVSNNARANDYVIASASVVARGNRVTTAFTLPDNLPWETIVAKVTARRKNETGAGACILKVGGK